MSISHIYRGLTPIEGITSQSQPTQPAVERGKTSEFQNLLDQKVQVSNHAQTRIRSRELTWNADLENRVARGIDSAESKGSREALILADDTAVIANVKSRTIITAMDRSQMKERIFTNIDSAVLV